MVGGTSQTLVRRASDKDLEQFQNVKSILLVSLMSCRVINLEYKIGDRDLAHKCHVHQMFSRSVVSSPRQPMFRLSVHVLLGVLRRGDIAESSGTYIYH